MLFRSLDIATGKYLLNDKTPSRRVGEIDNRGSHFYLALYWAQALAEQNDNAELKAKFAPIAQQLTEKESVIIDELNKVQGPAVDLGGYYMLDEKLANAAMRPSATLNAIIDSI